MLELSRLQNSEPFAAAGAGLLTAAAASAAAPCFPLLCSSAVQFVIQSAERLPTALEEEERESSGKRTVCVLLAKGEGGDSVMQSSKEISN